MTLSEDKNCCFLECSTSIEHFQHYMSCFQAMLGLGVPTTCCYQHLKEDDELTFIQFFIMEGLSCCVLLTNYLMHIFYGHYFTHHTSLCIALDNVFKVYVLNKIKSCGTLLAWGARGSGSDFSD